MADVTSQLDKLLAAFPADGNTAKQKIQEIADSFRAKKAASIDPNTILKVHPTGKVKQEKDDNRYEIFLIYSKSGASTAAALKPHLVKSLLNDSFLEYEAAATFDAKKLETDVANSLLVVFLLTDATLFEPAIIFAMEAVQHKNYKNIHPLLVHDASSCFFPGGEQQADSIKHLFAEKAVSLLPDYLTVAADEIALRLEEITAAAMTPDPEEGAAVKTLKSTNHKHNLVFFDPDGAEYTCNSCNESSSGERYHCMLCSYDLCEECAEESKESIKTSCFLSHKRTTAQVIAGRLYEGLKDDYKVFLDSEAKFKIHDLEKIVEQTDWLVLILSAGYLDSYWCLQELRAALKFKKPVVVVRDITYKLPPRESLAEAFNDVKSSIYDSPTIVWVAEYNTPCLQVLKKRFLGPSEYQLSDFDEFWEKNKEDIESTLKEDGYLDFSAIDQSDEGEQCVTDLLHAYALRNKATIGGVKAVRLAGLDLSEDDDILALDVFPNLEKLDLSYCSLGGSVKHLGRAAPNLKVLSVSCTMISDLPFMSMIRKLEHLEELDAGRCNITKYSLFLLSEKCPKLKVLRVGGTQISKKGLKKFKKALPTCQLDLTVPDDEEEEEEEEEEQAEEQAEEEEEENAEEEEQEEDE